MIFGVDLAGFRFFADDVAVVRLEEADFCFVLAEVFLIAVFCAGVFAACVTASTAVDEAMRAAGGRNSVAGAGATTGGVIGVATFGGSSSITSAVIGGSGAVSTAIIGGASGRVFVGVSDVGEVGELGGTL